MVAMYYTSIGASADLSLSRQSACNQLSHKPSSRVLLHSTRPVVSLHSPLASTKLYYWATPVCMGDQLAESRYVKME